jgi:regulatory protein
MVHPKIPSKDKDENPFFAKALQIALRLLTHRNHTRFELQQKLSQRGFSKEIIEKVLSDCERWDYLNDTKTAYFFVESLIRRGLGIYRIQKAMRQKGFSCELIKRSMCEHDLLKREPELAKKALKKKESVLGKTKTGKKRKEALLRFLVSRGFSPSTISSLLEMTDLWEEGL